MNSAHPERDPITSLTKDEQERLHILAEELFEAGQSVQKILRHGYKSYHPDEARKPANERITNDMLLVDELLDVDAARLAISVEGECHAVRADHYTPEDWLARWIKKLRFTYYQAGGKLLG